MSSFLPILFVVLSALVYYLSGFLLSGQLLTSVQVILWVAILFGFGLTLTYYKKKNRSWFKKVVIALFLFLILGLRLSWFNALGFETMLEKLALSTRFVDLLIVWCGWTFFQ